MALTPEQQEANRRMVEAHTANDGFSYNSASVITINGVGYRTDGSIVGGQQAGVTAQDATKGTGQSTLPPMSGGSPQPDPNPVPVQPVTPTVPTPVTPATPSKMYYSLRELEADLGREYQPGDRVYGVAPFSSLQWAKNIDSQRNNIEMFDYWMDWDRYDRGLEMRPETGYIGPTGPSSGAIALSQALTAGGNPLSASQAASIAGMDVGYRGNYGGESGAAAGLAGTIEAAILALTPPSAPAAAQSTPAVDVAQQAMADAEKRAGYTDYAALGDINTQKLVAVGGIQDLAKETGIALEQQRQAALLTPGTRDDQFFAGELQRWTQNKIEISGAYHALGMKGDVPIAANPYEYAGDLALALQKGGNPKDFVPAAYGFNPDVGRTIGLLPGGKGLQETSWDVARTGQPSTGSFENAIIAVSQAEGLYGAYGKLAGGKEDTRSAFEGINIPKPVTSYGEQLMALPAPFRSTIPGTPAAQGNNPLIPSVSAAGQDGATGGVQIDWAAKKPFVSTLTPAAPAAAPSLLDGITKGFGDLNKDISDKYLKPYLPDLSKTSSDTLSTAARFAGFMIPGLGAITSNPLYGKQASEFIGGVAVGEYTGLRENPVTALATTAIGFGMGAGFKVIDTAGTKAAAIAVNDYPRAVKAFSAFSGDVPKILGGLYAADVAIRSTGGLSDFDAARSGQRLGGIISTEVVPLAIGGVAGYKVADTIISRAPSLYTLPGETQILAGAKREDLPATRATLDIFKNIDRVESPMKNRPDLSKVSGVQDRAVGIEKIISTQDPTVYGRSTEIGQMPQDWINLRGTTKDVDYFTPRPSEAGKVIAKAYPKDYVPKDGADFTALMSPKTGQTALDIHPYPEGYAGGKRGLEAPTGDYVKAQINPIPDAKGILKTQGLPQEKLYVQTRRKATSVLGERPGEFGPPEHRMKDVVDLLNYDSYLGQQTSGVRRATLERSFNTLKDYYSRPEVYGRTTQEGTPRYQDGEMYADIIKRMEFGKPTEGATLPKGIGFEDVRFSSVPTRSPVSVYPSTFGASVIPSIASPWILPRSPSTASRGSTKSSPSPSPSPSPFTSVLPSPSPSPRSQSVSPFVSPSLLPSPRSQSPSPRSQSPSVTPSPSGGSPYIAPYVQPYTPPRKDTPSINPTQPRTPSPVPFKDSPSITPPPPRTPSPYPWKDTPSITPPPPPSPTPTPHPWHEYPPPPPTPRTPGLPPSIGGSGGAGILGRPSRRRNVSQLGLDVSVFGATRPGFSKGATYKSPIPTAGKIPRGFSPNLQMPQMPAMRMPGMPVQKRRVRRKGK